MCTDFSKVANIPIDDKNSYKFVLDWINKALKDLPKQIRCVSVETIVLPTTVRDEVSCKNNNIEHVTNNLVVIHCSGHLPCLRKPYVIHSPKEEDYTKKSLLKYKYM